MYQTPSLRARLLSCLMAILLTLPATVMAQPTGEERAGAAFALTL